jgi:HSP20 family protein
MAKRDKEGEGAQTAMQTSEQKSPQRMAERSQLAGVRAEHHPFLRLRDEMDQMLSRFFGGWPAAWEPMGFSERFWNVDVQESDNEVVVRAEAPGFEAKDFNIHVTGNTLTVEAEHKEEGEEREEGGHRWHRHYGRFQRSISLSTAVNADKVEAHYRNGVLDVHLPRTEPRSSRRIEVKS